MIRNRLVIDTSRLYYLIIILGSRSTLVNMEARSISSAVLTRRCIVARLGELTLERYRMLVDQNAGALLILLPSELGNLSADLKEVWPRIVSQIQDPV